jgi:endoplasmic reticulum-Golgi intermediate compartment protein 3
VYGHLEVPKVAGNVHFAPGHGVQHAYAHVHDLVSFTHSAFNISHVINSLSFGDYFPVRAPPWY